jgi:hypothetical protein
LAVVVGRQFEDEGIFNMRDVDEAVRQFGTKWRGWTYDVLIREVVLWGSVLAMFTSALVMVGFFFLAAAEGVIACATFIGLRPLPAGFSSASTASMALGLKAVELALLAPLGYVFVSALTNFVQALVEQEDDEKWADALRIVVGVKSLATSLLISIAAADFVGKILQERSFDIVNTLIEVLIVVILIGYLIVLERSQHATQPAHRRP